MGEKFTTQRATAVAIFGVLDVGYYHIATDLCVADSGKFASHRCTFLMNQLFIPQFWKMFEADLPNIPKTGVRMLQ